MPAMTAEQISERVHFAQPEGIEIIDNAMMADVSQALDDALMRKSGHPLFNPQSLRLKDFDFQFFRARFYMIAGDSGLNCLFIHKASNKTLVSGVDLWPRNDFWVITAELGRLG